MTTKEVTVGDKVFEQDTDTLESVEVVTTVSRKSVDWGRKARERASYVDRRALDQAKIDALDAELAALMPGKTWGDVTGTVAVVASVTKMEDTK